MMEPRKVKTFASRSGGFRWHDVWLHPDGSLTCTCPAGERGIRCWAINKVAGQMEVDKILEKRGTKKPPVDTFDMVAWIAECSRNAQAAFKEWARCKPVISLAEIKRHWAETDELHRRTREAMTRSHWDHYYAQFIKQENQDE